MRDFKDIASNDHFCSKGGILNTKTPKRGYFEFSAEKQKRHFFTFIEPRLHEKKLEKSDAQFSRKTVTDERTDERTNGRTSVNP